MTLIRHVFQIWRVVTKLSLSNTIDTSFGSDSWLLIKIVTYFPIVSIYRVLIRFGTLTLCHIHSDFGSFLKERWQQWSVCFPTKIKFAIWLDLISDLGNLTLISCVQSLRRFWAGYLKTLTFRHGIVRKKKIKKAEKNWDGIF